ncbi:MAG TPA: fibronectin type III domain-containing protein [Propionibacteriaceae bacterium]
MTGLRRHQLSSTRPRYGRRWALPFVISVAFLLISLPPPPAQAVTRLLIEPQLGDASAGPAETYAVHTAMNGNRLVVSSQGQSGYTLQSYRRKGNAWVLDDSITTAASVRDLALSGDTLAVAEESNSVGQVALYDLDAPTAPPRVLTAQTDVGHPSAFGNAVAVDGNRLIISVASHEPFVYDRENGAWPDEPSATLPLPDMPSYGPVIDVSGNTVIAGGPSAVVVFRYADQKWSKVDQVRKTGGVVDPAGPDPILLSGDTIVLADNQARTQGILEVHARKSDGWPLSQTILVPDGVAAAALDDSELAVVDLRGKVTLFTRGKSSWVEGPSTSLAEGRPEGFLNYGLSASVSGPRITVGQSGYNWGDAGRGSGRLVPLRLGQGPATQPNAPTQLTATFPTQASATVSWKATSGPTVTRYRVQLKSGINIISGVERYVPASTRSTTFSQLVPLAPYWFSVQAVGPGGESVVAKTETQYVPGPATVASPLLLRDPTGDVTDARFDLTALAGAANGDTFTVTVRTAAPRDPYTDPLFRGSGDRALFDVDLLTPAERNGRFQHVSNNGAQKIPGEDFTFRFLGQRPKYGCPNAIVPARYVDGAYQASLPVGCFDHGRALRLQAFSRPGSDPTLDDTRLTRPIRRVTTTRGDVKISAARVSSKTVWAKTDARITVSITASHASGIKRVVLMPFNITNHTRPVRVGAVTCRPQNKTTSTCSATFVARPGELRDLDAGLWRVFAQVEARSGAATVDENAATFSVRRGADLTGDGTVTGSRLAFTGHLSGARWSKRGYADLADRPVRLQRKAAGSNSYTTIRKLTTDADGNVAGTVSSPPEGTWRLVFDATKTYAGRSVVIARTG